MVLRADSQDGFRWKCRCGKTRMICDGSFFQFPNSPLEKIVLIMYFWAMDASVWTWSGVTVLSEHRVIDWYNVLREECSANFFDFQ